MCTKAQKEATWRSALQRYFKPVCRYTQPYLMQDTSCDFMNDRGGGFCRARTLAKGTANVSQLVQLQTAELLWRAQQEAILGMRGVKDSKCP